MLAMWKAQRSLPVDGKSQKVLLSRMPAQSQDECLRVMWWDVFTWIQAMPSVPITERGKNLHLPSLRAGIQETADWRQQGQVLWARMLLCNEERKRHNPHYYCRQENTYSETEDRQTVFSMWHRVHRQEECQILFKELCFSCTMGTFATVYEYFVHLLWIKVYQDGP